MYNDVITFLTIASTVNSVGDPIESITRKDVFAEVRSIGMKESYEALTAGLHPEYTFVIADYYDYDDQKFIEYNSIRYRVLRTYRKATNELEIVVTR